MPAPTKPNTFSNTPANTNAIDADQVNANFDVLYSLLNKGVDASNTTNVFAKDAVEPAFERYKDLFAVSSRGITSATAQKYFFQPSGAPPVVSPSTSTFNVGPIRYLDPADRTAGSRANYYRVRAWCSQNLTANGVTLTVGLYPVTFTAGTAGNPNTYTLGTVVAGSSVAFASGANSQNQANSGDFAAPSAGYYAIGLTSSGSQAGNALSDIDAVLQYRQV